MKQRIFFALAALIMLFCFTGCFAEATFEEVPFGVPSDDALLQEEDFFEEAFFGAEELEAGLLLEGAAADELPEGTPDDAEERTVVIVPDKDISQEDWATKTPKLTVSVPKGKGKVALSWTLDGQTKRTGLPGDVKFYVYEWLEDKGAWVQAAGPVKGFSVTLKNVAAGDHVYIVRLERVNKNKTENYGISSEKVPTPVPVLSDRWMKKPKLKGVQSGVNEVTLTWTVAEKADYYRIDRKIGKQYLPAGSTSELKWVDGNAAASNAYRVVPVKAFGWGEAEGKAAGVSVKVIEYWKTKPKILSVVENDNGTFTIRWTTTLNLPPIFSGEGAIYEDHFKWDSEFPHAFFISDGSGTVRFTKFDADFKDVILNKNGEFEYTTLDKATAKKKKQAYLGGGSTLSFTVQPAMYLGPTADKEYRGAKSDPFVYRRKLSDKDGAQNVKSSIENGMLKVEWDACKINRDAPYFCEFGIFVMRDDDGFSDGDDSGQGEAHKYFLEDNYGSSSEKKINEALQKYHYTKNCKLEPLGSEYGSFSWYLETSYYYRDDPSKVMKVVKTKLESFTVYDPGKTAPVFTKTGTQNLYFDPDWTEVNFGWEGGTAPYELEINKNGAVEMVTISGTSSSVPREAGSRYALRVREQNGPWSKPLYINVYQPINIVAVTDNLPKSGDPKPGKDYKFTIKIEGGSGRYSYQLWEQRRYPLDAVQSFDRSKSYWIDEVDETTSRKASLVGQFDIGENVIALRVRDKITNQNVAYYYKKNLTGAAWYDRVEVTQGKTTRQKNGKYTISLNWPASKAGLKPSKYRIYEGDKLIKTVGGSAKGAKLTDVIEGVHLYTVRPVLNFGDNAALGIESDPVAVTIP